eukprot:GHVU01024697.1.p1 GENE.GHVU01024697.1~~GHVU01024697.1.p1  ORF type:complete len:132 (-),score=3.64 GHVU01024697.1:286-681(-)
MHGCDHSPPLCARPAAHAQTHGRGPKRLSVARLQRPIANRHPSPFYSSSPSSSSPTSFASSIISSSSTTAALVQVASDADPTKVCENGPVLQSVRGSPSQECLTDARRRLPRVNPLPLPSPLLSQWPLVAG